MIMTSKPRRKLKGQFFLIAGLLLALMFFAGLPTAGTLVQTPVAADLKYAYENIEYEFARALNLGLNESDQIDTLKNFTVFMTNSLSTRSIALDTLWAVSEGNTSSMINVTVGNFLASAVNVTLNLTDAGGTHTITYMDVPKDSANWTEFHSVTSDFNLTLAFNDDSGTVEWERDKVNIYALVNMTRGETIKKEQFSF